jgi:hypothetical protein
LFLQVHVEFTEAQSKESHGYWQCQFSARVLESVSAQNNPLAAMQMAGSIKAVKDLQDMSINWFCFLLWEDI